MKKSILFIADKPDWAYHNIIKVWTELLSEYNCYIAFTKDYSIRAKKFSLIDILKNKFSQLKSSPVKYKIHSSRKYSYPVYKEVPVYEVFSGKKVSLTHFDITIELAYYFQYTAEFPFTADKKYVGLFTDCYPHEGPSYDFKNNVDLKTLNREDFFKRYISHYNGLIAGSYNLYNDYKKFNFPIALSNAIYKADKFVENNNIGDNEYLTIGWTGTPDREMKGFRSIIEPAIKELQEDGFNIKLKTKFSGSYDDLLTFYTDVDLVVIASSADTGPSLFAEASLCKVPSISTKIGFPNSVINDGKNGLFINRDKEELKQAIIKLYNDRTLLKKFSGNIKQDFLRLFSNEILIHNLKDFLNQ